MYLFVTAHFLRMSARCLAVWPFQPEKALSAAAMAHPVSVRLQLGTVAMTSCVLGFTTCRPRPGHSLQHASCQQADVSAASCQSSEAE